MIDVFVVGPKFQNSPLLDYAPHAKCIESTSCELTTEVLDEILSKSLTRYFYVINNYDIRIADFGFTYQPTDELSNLIHLWDNNPAIRLFDKEHITKFPEAFTDWYFKEGNAPIYNHPEKICEVVDCDIVFMSYDESFADENYNKLLARFPRAKRIHGVKGIYNAHKAAAELATTSMVYIVDADAVVTDSFDFTYKAPVEHLRYVHVWKSHNPLNGLEYGNGGIKLFPTSVLRSASEWNIDFTTSVFDGLIEMEQVSNTICIDRTDFDSWKSAFRECVKLSSRIIKNQVDDETEARLQAWVSRGNAQSKRGALAGVTYGEKYKDNPVKLNKINNYKWLRVMFHKKR